MKRFSILAVTFLAIASQNLSHANGTKMDWSGLEKEKIDLALPLLVIKGSKGFLACGYIAPSTCDKTGEACAIVSGVKTYDDMLDKDIKAVSEKAAKLGIKVGMSGRDALKLLK